MPISEYEHKFNELSSFALELVPNEEEKCMWFEEGLWTKIQMVITANTCSFMRVMSLAIDLVSHTLRSTGMARRRQDTTNFSDQVRVYQRKVGLVRVLLEVVG